MLDSGMTGGYDQGTKRAKYSTGAKAPWNTAPPQEGALAPSEGLLLPSVADRGGT